MASAAMHVAETQSRVSQETAWLASTQGNIHPGDETPSSSVRINPRGSPVDPYHTGDTVTAMANRIEVEIVLKDLDDPDVILHPLPPGPKSMVCRNVSVATLTSLLKSQYSLHEVDYYVFKFVADDVDSK